MAPDLTANAIDLVWPLALGTCLSLALSCSLTQLQLGWDGLDHLASFQAGEYKKQSTSPDMPVAAASGPLFGEGKCKLTISPKSTLIRSACSHWPLGGRGVGKWKTWALAPFSVRPSVRPWMGSLAL